VHKVDAPGAARGANRVCARLDVPACARCAKYGAGARLHP